MGRNKLEKRLIKSRKMLEKSIKKLEIERFRRIKAEQGKVLAALFGKPKKRK